MRLVPNGLGTRVRRIHYALNGQADELILADHLRELAGLLMHLSVLTTCPRNNLLCDVTSIVSVDFSDDGPPGLYRRQIDIILFRRAGWGDRPRRWRGTGHPSGNTPSRW